MKFFRELIKAMKNLLVAQSGGPTVAINATLFGILKKAQELKISRVYGARFGITGVFNEDILDLTHVFLKKETSLLLQTPSSCLGSCRYKLKDVQDSQEEYERILAVFLKYNIKYFIYIGGNDSMDTVMKISDFFQKKGILDVFVVGAPKTIDNDLLITDHCPGFGSAAKFVATTFAELKKDCSVYSEKSVTLVETMGRDSGWLAAASCLSRVDGTGGVDLIYCCEKSFSIEEFLIDIEEKFKEQKTLLIAISEGLKDKNGEYLYMEKKRKEKDVFGHSNSAGVAKFLADVVKNEFGCKVRAIELNSPQRAAVHLASKTDIDEAVLVGEKAVELAWQGKTKVMVTILRKEQGYDVTFGFVDVLNVANKIKLMPMEYLNEKGNDVTKKAVAYLEPLILGELEIKHKKAIPVFFDIFKVIGRQ